VSFDDEFVSEDNFRNIIKEQASIIPKEEFSKKKNKKKSKKGKAVNTEFTKKAESINEAEPI